MPIVSAIKKGVDKGKREYLSKINLALLIIILTAVIGSFYYSYSSPKEIINCTSTPTQSPNTVVYESIGGREIIVTANTTVVQGNDCYLTYICANNSKECTPPSNQTTSCYTISQTCSTSSQCCSDLTCQSGTCQPPANQSQSCLGISEFCSSSSQCCSGYFCSGGTCQPTY